VALFERSGKGVKSFCRENELTASGLWAWRRLQALVREQQATLAALHEQHLG